MSKLATSPLKLDLACGQLPHPGYLGVDIWEGADFVCNLEQYPWPFEDGSVDEIFCSHYVEHVPDLVSFVNELYRILKPEGKAVLIAPYYSSIRAWQDPTHLRAISENTFLYFDRDWREYKKLDHYPIYADFEFECSFRVHPDFEGKEPGELEFAKMHYINVIEDIRATLVKRDGRARTARLQWDAGRHEEAVSICRELISAGAAGAVTLLMTAEYALRKGEHDESLGLFREVLLKDPDSLQALTGVLRVLIAAGRGEEAREHLSSLRERDAELAEVVEMVAGDGDASAG